MVEESSRTALYGALTGNSPLMALIKGVYDHVPQPGDPGEAAEFPYIALGDFTFIPWDTDTETGAEATATFHTWSRYKGRAEVAKIHDALYAALHRAELTVAGFKLIGCEFEYAEVLVEPDGETRHGVQRYRLVLDKE